MLIRIKLMASFKAKLPVGAKEGAAELELPPGATVADVLARLDIPARHVHLVMVNGSQEPDRQRVLVEGDELVIFPPVAGGGS
jgi:sulfur carrier protein ThiS